MGRIYLIAPRINYREFDEGPPLALVMHCAPGARGGVSEQRPCRVRTRTFRFGAPTSPAAAHPTPAILRKSVRAEGPPASPLRYAACWLIGGFVILFPLSALRWFRSPSFVRGVF